MYFCIVREFLLSRCVLQLLYVLDRDVIALE